ncbi:MAG: FtsX-like permease family protein [Bacteroidetes bacterium]|jgi:putative ABC transport system permease protein|nr:FtsX-like permease family protein [Bacteroidota bacterium]MBT4401006.1 FtsX-like permease family protein [Bacteroidota bacterium]MBT4408262.1 FtsX-like permease family protein [Bacteroidota bacterium]MBT5427126.1 FtsX-like permease family protein [Bacteroidota bacterium]MBT7093877.1 FtsX-like permease family protein [Bacteroidota bacterium]
MLFIKEILHRKINFIFTILGVTLAVAILVSFYSITKASKNETRLLTRDMGFNLRIIPSETNMNDFWMNGFSGQEMSEDLIQRLIEQRSLNYAHLTASLHKQIIWNNQAVILSGLSPNEVEPSGSRKSKMIFAIPKGKLIIGYEVAANNNIREGDLLTIMDNGYTVERILAEAGSIDDIRIFFDLADLQNLINKPGVINEIMALNCMCSTKGDNPLEVLREELARIIPEAKVVMNSSIAVARERQRKMGDKYFNVVIPLLLIVCLVWIALSSLNNVNHRFREIGVLRALGFGTGRIAVLFFLRAALAGIVAAFTGYFLGTWLAGILGPEIFKVAPDSVKAVPALLGWSVFIAPIFSCIASFIPIMWAISRDTATILKQD